MKRILIFFVLFVYNFFIYLVQPIVFLYFFLKKKCKYYDRKKIQEIFFPKKKKIVKNGILFHAASVGEIRSIYLIVKYLINKYPKLSITISSVTDSGKKQFDMLFPKNRVSFLYFPYDVLHLIKKFLSLVKPSLIILVEKEIWPNLIMQAKIRKIPIIIVNAGISDKSFKRYKIFKIFAKEILEKITFFAVQSKYDANKFFNLGVEKNKILEFGNIKFDTQIEKKLKKKIANLKKIFRNQRKIWIASSTHRGEEKFCLQAYQKIKLFFPNLLLIIFPRNPERFLEVEKIISSYKLNYITRNNIRNINKEVDVILGNTIGELMLFYAISNVAFIGGSMKDKFGGHNPIEAAINSIPILVGPFYKNFREIYENMHSKKTIIIVKDLNSIVKSIKKLLQNDTLRKKIGEKAKFIAKNNKGASKKIFQIISRYFECKKKL
ncbi:3-deoxy-D-manno-octulosonic acid transferase [bacterium endosymbiont of Pedicinus badii]|uniref:3-deoxy-D-manno-octulosonic acid transferase n=1 Tax=bacterium endosymbiont of Pedicinus badii TaxID=1719126 RepID=UPI0009B9CBEF|nr:3-deoxy-D-manno-octulosonic acid transferase [bacterium endosymbiont of Pedicinus badii]OQM34059.1 hypothetical protein AOQ89_01730 [bacterium endosymbiont of Pedicinus badii]